MMSLECPISDKKLVVGYTTREHLVLDLDNTSIRKVWSLAIMLMENYPEIGHCIIMRSSREKGEPFTRITKKGIPRLHLPKACYHLIFDNVIGYKRCIQIILTLVDLDILDHQYKRIRMFRGDMTVRISPMVLSETIKEAPIPVMQVTNIYTHNNDNKIRDYLSAYNAVNGTVKFAFLLDHG